MIIYLSLLGIALVCLITLMVITSLIILIRKKRAIFHPENASSEPVYEDIQEVNRDELKTAPNVCYATSGKNNCSIEPVYTEVDRLYSVIQDNTIEA